MGGGPRDVAEHFVDLHSSRLLAEETARRLSGRGKDYHLGPADMKLEEVVNYLERVRDRAERGAPPTRRTQETQTIPAALLPVTSSFLLQELPSTPPQHLHQVGIYTYCYIVIVFSCCGGRLWDERGFTDSFASLKLFFDEYIARQLFNNVVVFRRRRFFLENNSIYLYNVVSRRKTST